MTRQDFLKQIVKETAKMSYPGMMSMGSRNKQIVVANTKNALADYLLNNFPVEKLWDRTPKKQDFDSWHHKMTQRISETVVKKKLGNQANNPYAVSAKFLNTFMHQLMKY